MEPNSSQTISVDITSSDGDVDETTYTTTDSSVLNFGGASSITSTTKTSFPVTLNSDSPGTATIEASSEMVDEGGIFCTPNPETVSVTVDNPSGWCQFRATDVVVAGDSSAPLDISCPIPASCELPDCDPNLITYDPALDEEPGVAVASGTISTGDGDVSDPQNWQAEDVDYNGTFYQYANFKRKLPSGFLSSSNLPGPDIIPGGFSGGAPRDGYEWYLYDGSVLGDLNLGTTAAGDDFDLLDRKVIVFVENASVNINSNINLTDGEGLFVLISEGDINVFPGDGADPATAVTSLEGVYFAEGIFRTGTLGTDDDEQLTVRGSVAAGGIALQRTLADNSETPAETFQFAPDQFFLFPELLGEQPTDWREVAP